MADQIRCTCGAVLVEEITEVGVRPVGSDEVLPFRRTTDYVICPACFESYEVAALISEWMGDETG